MVKRFGKNTTAHEILEGFDLQGQTFFLTSGNSGKGFQTARALALKNAHVVIGSKSIVHALEAREDILLEKSAAKVDVLQLDNADLQSVKDCAEKYIAKGWPLHCLILNASVHNPMHRITDDEFETTFQVNHLAHFLLTDLLRPLLIANSPSRIVVVTSRSHRSLNVIGLAPRDIKWERLSPTQNHSLNSPTVAYDLSKLCNILFAKALHERLCKDGVTVTSVSPGTVRRIGTDTNFDCVRCCMKMATPWMKTEEQAAAAIVYCAASSELTPDQGGSYFEDCHAKLPSTPARKGDVAERLWHLSELMLQTYQEKFQRTCAKFGRKTTPSTALVTELQPILEDIEKDSVEVTD